MNDEERQSRHMKLLSPKSKLIIVMVGLPARGKSYMAKKIYRYLVHLHVKTKVFNLGSYRRNKTKYTTVGKTSSNFFDPSNQENMRIRDQCCLDGLTDLISWWNDGGEVGIFDGTNSSINRRKMIRKFIKDKGPFCSYNIDQLYVESICENKEIIENNIISVKLKNPDYVTVDREAAIRDFYERITMYKKVYNTIIAEEGAFIKVIDVGNDVVGHSIHNYLSLRILYFLMHLNLYRTSKNRNNDIPGNNNQTSISNSNTNENQTKLISPKNPTSVLMRRSSFLLWEEEENTYLQSPSKNQNNSVSLPMASTSLTPNTSYTTASSPKPSIPEHSEVETELPPFIPSKITAKLVQPPQTQQDSPITPYNNKQPITPYNNQAETPVTPHSHAPLSNNPSATPSVDIDMRPRVTRKATVLKLIKSRNSNTVSKLHANSFSQSISKEATPDFTDSDSNNENNNNNNNNDENLIIVSENTQQRPRFLSIENQTTPAIDQTTLSELSPNDSGYDVQLSSGTDDDNSSNNSRNKKNKNKNKIKKIKKTRTKQRNNKSTTNKSINEKLDDDEESKFDDSDSYTDSETPFDRMANTSGMDLSTFKQFEKCSIVSCSTIFDDDNPRFMCRLCNRVICSNCSSKVESRDNENELIRICDICLYESDTDEEAYDYDYGNVDPGQLQTNPNSDIQSEKISAKEHLIKNKISELLKSFDNKSKEEIKLELQNLTKKIVDGSPH